GAKADTRATRLTADRTRGSTTLGTLASTQSQTRDQEQWLRTAVLRAFLEFVKTIVYQQVTNKQSERQIPSPVQRSDHMSKPTQPTALLSEAEKRDLTQLIQADKPLPDKYRFLLFEDKREIELVWNGKSTDVCNAVLPFQTPEHIDEPREETRVQRELFDTRGRQTRG